jgi:hypothetical protein
MSGEGPAANIYMTEELSHRCDTYHHNMLQRPSNFLGLLDINRSVTAGDLRHVYVPSCDTMATLVATEEEEKLKKFVCPGCAGAFIAFF